MTAPEKYLIVFLRITAVLLMSAAGAVVMPYAWMNAAHHWLGFGTLPDQPLVAYLTRSLSALYAGLGVYSWFLARDVKRYLPLLEPAIPLSFAFSLILILIDVLVEMPTWWTAIEAPFVLGWTFLLWRLVRRMQKSEADA